MRKYFFCFFFALLWVLISCEDFHDPDRVYHYQIPAVNEEFPVASLEAVELDEQRISQMTNLIQGEFYKRIDGLLILKNNQLVYESYFHGYTGKTLHNIYSSGKSITSILTGIALDKGLIQSVDVPVLGLLPEYADHQNKDSRKSQITIKHLLNMTAGFAWQENTETRMRASPDWVKFTLDLPLAANPGTQGNYATGGVVVLGRIIENQSGLNLAQFAEKYLFGPLGIKEYKWDLMPNGRISAGGSLYLRPRDMAKIGLLMLNKGLWNGKRIVSSEWVEMSGENNLRLPGPFDGYGYLWWKQSFLKDNMSLQTYFSSGNGGQDIFIIPAKNMVLVFTTGNVNTSLGLQNIYLMRDYIIPAIK